MRKWWIFCAAVAACLLVVMPILDAQRGPGRGPGKGRNPGGKGGPGGGNWRLPALEVKDVKPEGAYQVVNLLPAPGEQPRLGITSDYAYRLVGVDAQSRALTFATLDLKSGAQGSKKISLPSGAPDLGDSPRMSFDGGEWAVVSRQAATLFVNVKDGKVSVAAGLDDKVSRDDIEPRRESRRQRARAGERYRVHGGSDGRWALSVLKQYNPETDTYAGRGGVLHIRDRSSVGLKWDHNRYGVPPHDRDAVCAVTDDEIIVLVTRPRSSDSPNGACDLTCLVFDRKGNFKEAQTSPQAWAGSNAATFAISPNGRHVVAHPEDGLHRVVATRGTWERGYKTDYHDALVGFAPDGDVAVFLENHSSELAILKAVSLPGGEAVWTSAIKHDKAGGEGDKEPFTSVGPGAQFVATRHGILKGEDGDRPSWIYNVEPVDFSPLCISYDSAGKQVAVLALDRVFVMDAKSCEEVYSIPLPAPLPAAALGEFVAFDSRGRKVMACARGHGVWLIDLRSGEIEETLPTLPGAWARAMPDFSGVVYSRALEDGGDVVIHRFGEDDAESLFSPETRGARAVCFYVSDRCDRFLVAEREVERGRLFLMDDDGRKQVTYDLSGLDENMSVGSAITGFVTRRNQAVLINEVSRWRYTGINCTVIGAGKGPALESTFSAVFESDELPGRSTYGATAASPFFGAVHAGDERDCAFACPAGVLKVEISKSRFTLYAWSREPSGLAAVSPRGKEFFVAGSTGLTTYQYD